jgi:hypothetical protein
MDGVSDGLREVFLSAAGGARRGKPWSAEIARRRRRYSRLNASGKRNNATVAIAVRNVSGRRRWSKLDEWLRLGAPSRSSNSSKAD